MNVPTQEERRPSSLINQYSLAKGLQNSRQGPNALCEVCVNSESRGPGSPKRDVLIKAVSYTHLTLPTIYSV